MRQTPTVARPLTQNPTIAADDSLAAVRLMTTADLMRSNFHSCLFNRPFCLHQLLKITFFTWCIYCGSPLVVSCVSMIFIKTSFFFSNIISVFAAAAIAAIKQVKLLTNDGK